MRAAILGDCDRIDVDVLGVMTVDGGRVNVNGGTLYVGVPVDPKQPPMGVDNAERAAQELRTLVERALTPRLDLLVDVVESRGKKIIRVTGSNDFRRG